MRSTSATDQSWPVRLSSPSCSLAFTAAMIPSHPANRAGNMTTSRLPLPEVAGKRNPAGTAVKRTPAGGERHGEEEAGEGVGLLALLEGCRHGPGRGGEGPGRGEGA